MIIIPTTQNLFIQESYINKTEGYRFGDPEVHETQYNSRGDVYRFAVREYGRCVSRVFIDTDKGAKTIGWVFEKRAKYNDTGEPYLQETWITLHDAPPTKTIEYHYV